MHLPIHSLTLPDYPAHESTLRSPLPSPQTDEQIEQEHTESWRDQFASMLDAWRTKPKPLLWPY